MQVTIYSTSNCPYCRMLKDYLKEREISFSEKAVDIDEAARDEMIKESGGFLGVPFTVILKDDGTRETIVGFDKGRINQVLKIE